MNYCEYCGEKLDKSTPFCPYCGNSLNTPEHILKYSIDNKDEKTPDDNTFCSPENLPIQESLGNIQANVADTNTDGIINEENEDDDNTSSDSIIESSITVEDTVEYTYGPDTVSCDQPSNTTIDYTPEYPSTNAALSEADVHTNYNSFIAPQKVHSRGAKAMGIIGLVLGIISVVGTIHTFLSTINVFFQHEKSAILQCFYFILMYGAPGIVAIILSQRAIDNNFDGGISKAAEITGSIGTFCHIGVFFISIISLFI